MTGKSKKTKRRKARGRLRVQARVQPRRKSATIRPAKVQPATIAWLHASVEDDLLLLAEDETGAEPR